MKMKREFSNPVIAVTYFVSENILTASAAETVANTLTSADNTVLSLGGQSKIDDTKLFTFTW